jgi:hypothetical protein
MREYCAKSELHPPRRIGGAGRALSFTRLRDFESRNLRTSEILDQRDAGGPITICHPVTREAGWVPGYSTVLSVTPGTASAYGNP